VAPPRRGARIELDGPREPTSDTFHGRDIMAPAAGMLACGTPNR
jgi:S-adenosylmethionine hydrolase